MSYGIIYKATGPGGRVYIGQTTKTLAKRKKQHTYRAKLKDLRTPFQTALLEEGVSNFTWEQIDTADSQEELDRKERDYISLYDSMNPEKGYNNQDGGTHFTMSPETRKKISEAEKGEKGNNYGKRASEETRRKMSEAGKGRKHTEETRRKISEASHNISEETRRKRGDSLRGRKRPESVIQKMREANKKIWTPEKRAAHAKIMQVIAERKRGT